MKQKNIIVSFVPFPHVGGIGDCEEDMHVLRDIAAFINVLVMALIEGDANAADMLTRHLQVYMAKCENNNNIINDDEINRYNEMLESACERSGRIHAWVESVIKEAAKDASKEILDEIGNVIKAIISGDESETAEPEDVPAEIPEAFKDFVDKLKFD